MAKTQKNNIETPVTEAPVEQEREVQETVVVDAPPTVDEATMCETEAAKTAYVPAELRKRLEQTAIKMLDSIPETCVELNETQLKHVSAALEIYKHIEG